LARDRGGSLMANDEIAILSLSKKVRLDDVMAIAEACNRQAAEHVCPAWLVPYRPINVYSDPTKLPVTRTDVCTLQDEPGDAGPGVLAYHSLGITPFAKIFANPVLDNGGVILCDPDDNQRPSLAAVFSHELIELNVDPGVDQYAIDARGREIDLEIGDPFQTQSYPMVAKMPWGDVFVALSDFALPSWFKVKGKPPYNWMSDMAGFAGTAPFQISHGGYAMVNGDPVFARREDGSEVHPPAWWLAMRPPGRRRLRKGPVTRRLWAG
jgi:hypothetical protein